MYIWLRTIFQLLPGVKVAIANPDTKGQCADSHLGEVCTKCTLLLMPKTWALLRYRPRPCLIIFGSKTINTQPLGHKSQSYHLSGNEQYVDRVASDSWHCRILHWPDINIRGHKDAKWRFIGCRSHVTSRNYVNVLTWRKQFLVQNVILDK